MCRLCLKVKMLVIADFYVNVLVMNSFVLFMQVEYQLVKFDHANRRVRLALRTQEVLQKLREISETSPR